MDVNAIVGVINSVGFPIACVIFMAVLLYKQTETHKEEMNKIIDAINNNTVALAELKGVVNSGR